LFDPNRYLAVDPEASTLLRELTTSIEMRLQMHAQDVAAQGGFSRVMAPHVREAFARIFPTDAEPSPGAIVATSLGGAVFGAGASSVVSILTAAEFSASGFLITSGFLAGGTGALAVGLTSLWRARRRSPLGTHRSSKLVRHERRLRVVD
jgi:hypothetical protein